MTEEKSSVIKVPNVPFDVYCNAINITMSPYDLVFILKDNSPMDGEKTLGQIKMSPQHGKVFAELLNQYIMKYEEVFGEIPVNHDKLSLFEAENVVEKV